MIVQVIRPGGGFSSELVQHEDMVDVCKPRTNKSLCSGLFSWE